MVAPRAEGLFGAALGKPLGIALLVLVYLLARAFIDIDIYDEGIRLYGAMRVLRGDLPYHDFFTMYGPAQFYWPALWFQIFGEQLWAARLSELVFVAAAVAALAALLRQANVGWVGVLWAVASVLLPLVDTKLMTLDPALALALGAGLLVTRSRGKRWLAGAGLLLGCASLFRHDFAFYGALAAAATSCIEALAQEPPGRRGRSAARSIALIAAGSLALAVPAYAALALPDPAALWDCLAQRPFELMDLRRIPYGHALTKTLGYLARTVSFNNLLRLWVTLGVVLVPAALGVALASGRVRREVLHEPRRVATLTFLVTLAAGLSVYALARTDIFHLYPAHVVYAGVTSILAGAVFRAAGGSRRLLLGASGLFGVAVAAGLLGTLMRLHNRAPLALPRAQGIHVGEGGRWLAQAAADVERYAADKPIFVGSVRHDRVIANLMTTYFLTGREAATYYHDIVPGLTTSEPVQRRIIADLTGSGACAALLWETEPSDEPNRSATERGATLLDSYLASHFVVAVEGKRYRVLTRCGLRDER